MSLLKNNWFTELAELWWDEMQDHWIITSIVSLLVLCVVAFLGWVLLFFIDSAWTPEIKDNGIVVDKEYHQAYSSTTFYYSGKTAIPVSTFHPQQFVLIINISGKTGAYSTFESNYNSIEIGAKLKCTYSTGRLFHSNIYIHSINDTW